MSPNAYSIANLSIEQICNAMALKYNNHNSMLKLWDSLNAESAFGADFFLSKIEEEYSGKLVKNMDALSKEIDTIKTEGIN